MIGLRRSALPNVITVGRIIMAPAVLFLVLDHDFGTRLLAFALFLVAAFSDLWDGYLARKHGWISDFGKLWDPIADKLLLVCTFIPFYILTHGANASTLPFWGTLPLWVLFVVFGREVLITLIRAFAARRGVVIPAGRAGKLKTLAQNIFIGTTIFWFALESASIEFGWYGRAWDGWKIFHGTVLAVTLLLAVVLTVYSLVVYLWGWRSLARQVAR